MLNALPIWNGILYIPHIKKGTNFSEIFTAQLPVTLTQGSFVILSRQYNTVLISDFLFCIAHSTLYMNSYFASSFHLVLIQYC